MFADNRLQGRVIREEFGRDVPSAVEPLEEFEFVVLQGKDRGHELACSFTSRWAQDEISGCARTPSRARPARGGVGTFRQLVD